MKQIPETTIQRPEKEWKGYTLEELRYEQAVSLARIETQGDILAADFERVRSGNFFLNRNTFSKVLTMINYTDFMVIGFKLMRRIAPLFSRRKS